MGVRASIRSGSLPPQAHHPPTLVASAEQGNARSGAAAAEPPGRLASPCRAGRAPRTPPDPGLVFFGRTEPPGARRDAGGCAAPRRTRPAAPPPCHSPGPGGPLGIIPLPARRGRARRGSQARRRKGRATMCRGGGGRRQELLARSCSAAAGAGCRKSRHFGRKSGILTKHSRPAAAPRRGLPPRLTLGPPTHCRARELGQEMGGMDLFLTTEGRGGAHQQKTLALKWGLLKRVHLDRTVTSFPSCLDFSKSTFTSSFLWISLFLPRAWRQSLLGQDSI